MGILGDYWTGGTQQSQDIAGCISGSESADLAMAVLDDCDSDDDKGSGLGSGLRGSGSRCKTQNCYVYIGMVYICVCARLLVSVDNGNIDAQATTKMTVRSARISPTQQVCCHRVRTRGVATLMTTPCRKHAARQWNGTATTRLVSVYTLYSVQHACTKMVG